MRSFGDHGVVDLKTPEVMNTGKDKSYILPSPPLIYKNLVITGSGPGEGPGWFACGSWPRWRYPCLGCSDREVGVDVSLRAPARRDRARHLGG